MIQVREGQSASHEKLRAHSEEGFHRSSPHPMCVFPVFVHPLVSVKACSSFKRQIPLIHFNCVFFNIREATVHLETVNLQT